VGEHTVWRSEVRSQWFRLLHLPSRPNSGRSR
jgi:hypothetical protein